MEKSFNIYVRTIEQLDNICKEPKELLFFKGGVYECTYNQRGKFSHTQLAILLDLPNTEDVRLFKDIIFYVRGTERVENFCIRSLIKI